MIYRLFLLVSLFLGPHMTEAQIREQVVHDGYTRSWITVLPNDYSDDKSYPLVLALHGSAGNAKQLMNDTRRRFNKLASREGFIVVYPDGVQRSWNDNRTRDQSGFARKENIDDVGFFDKLLDYLESRYAIDSSHIFVCGISNGGLMSQTLAMERPGRYRAIGMVASNFGEDQVRESQEVKPFSILFIHGTADTILPYEKGVITVRNSRRGAVMGIPESIAYMRRLNGNTGDLVAIPLDDSAPYDDCTSEYVSYPHPTTSSLKVDLIKVTNGGHTWPGSKPKRLLKALVGKTTRDFNACDALWEFFKSTMD